MSADIVIKGGLVVDGSGSPARRADVAIDGGLITQVGHDVGAGRQELDAEGCIVTPGFVDPHTHYDGQATWDPWMAPSSQHGVTTVVMGNCGVGFAPVAPDKHDFLIEMMEGVEDIPGTALYEGISWGWESYPEYLAVLEGQQRTIDIASQLPHAALRAYAMGERGADPFEHPDEDELAQMGQLAQEALRAGAFGITTSRTEMHRTKKGENLGTLRAEEPELMVLAEALRATGRGVFQFLSDSYRTTDDEFAAHELALSEAFARHSGRPMSYTVQQDISAPDRWRDLLAQAERLLAEGLSVRAQVAPRPIGVMMGLDASACIFTPVRAYARVAQLPLAERVERMKDPELRQRIVDGHRALTSGPDAFAGLAFFGRLDDMYVLDDPVDYNLDRSRSLGAQARALGLDPREYAYDLHLQRGGRQLIYAPLFNFVHGNLDVVREMITSPAAMFGLSDAGAHCGQICDASMTTSFLTLWARDRQDAVPLGHVVHQLTRRSAEYFGLTDRGLVIPGLVADINVIDLEGLQCLPPEIAADLPAGGRRLLQRARGYRWTLKTGTVTFSDGEPTGALPGRLLGRSFVPAN